MENVPVSKIVPVRKNVAELAEEGGETERG